METCWGCSELTVSDPDHPSMWWDHQSKSATRENVSPALHAMQSMTHTFALL